MIEITPNGKECLVSAGNENATGRVVASIEYEGQIYQDVCGVAVVANDWEDVGALFSSALWNDSSKWLQQNYQDDGRELFIYNQYNDYLGLMYNDSGAEVSMYADIRPAADMFGNLDTETYDYRFFYRMSSSDGGFDIFSTTNSANVFAFNPVTVYGNDQTGYIQLVPIVNSTNERFVTIQIIPVTKPTGDYPGGFGLVGTVDLILQRKPKQ